MVHHLFGVEVKPALPALVPRPGVPCNAQDLVAAIGKLREVLLQRFGSERVGDFILGERPVGAVGAHPVGAVADEELGGCAFVGEPCIVEIAADRGRTRSGHRQVVVRAPPEFGFSHMAGGALFTADVVVLHLSGEFAVGRLRVRSAAQQQGCQQQGYRRERSGSCRRRNAGCAG